MHVVFIGVVLAFATLYNADAASKPQEVLLDGRGKRALPPNPGGIGFVATRGRRDADYEKGFVYPRVSGADTDDGDASYLPASVEKRAPSGFMGMRGKKPQQPWRGPYPDGYYKRAPSGFMGMRGKKDNEFAKYEEKRAPSGFFGMRGKKQYYGDKRAPMGFVGMRGKKSLDEEDSINDDKRAPSGFFGMRGKKQPSGFFGMRGKKQAYEFRGKFVGVRGKKTLNDLMTYEPEPDIRQLGQELDINQLMLLLTGENDPATDNYKQLLLEHDDADGLTRQ